jgi:purine-nucleoside phosphorylase
VSTSLALEEDQRHALTLMAATPASIAGFVSPTLTDEERLVFSLAARLRREIGGPIDVCIVAGSGVAESFSKLFPADRSRTINLNAVEGWPAPTVEGHGSSLVFTTDSRGFTICGLLGRVHLYEGGGAHRTVMATRVMAALGCRLLVLTNAAGSMTASLPVGQVMLIRDHVALPALTGFGNPLTGKNASRFGPRFPGMDGIYPSWLLSLAESIASEHGYGHRVSRGVYVQVSGPSFETRAELQFIRKACGGDAVGMSTCPEVIAAAHCGMAVVALSVITDAVPMLEDLSTPVSPEHSAVLKAAASASPVVGCILEGLVNDESVREIPRCDAAGAFDELVHASGGIDELEDDLRSSPSIESVTGFDEGPIKAHSSGLSSLADTGASTKVSSQNAFFLGLGIGISATAVAALAAFAWARLARVERVRHIPTRQE